MKLSFGDRLKHAWNVFNSKQEADTNFLVGNYMDLGPGSTYRNDRARLHLSTERSIIASLYNRIAIDVSSVPIKHVRTDQNGQYLDTIKSSLNDCLTVEANLDQTGRELIFDAVLSMFDEGSVAIVPVDTSVDIIKTGSFDILSLRVAKVVEWYPQNVKLEIWDEKVGSKRVVVLPKSKVALIENPFYSVMNEQNSTLKRLIRKLNLLDSIDEQSGSSKLDLIMQLPYAIRTPAQQKKAEDRKRSIESQLKDSKYGIAYVDATEKVTQLNRSVDNNLMSQIEYLTTTLYNQLGVTEAVFNGTADERTMLNYHNSTIEPILSAITNEMTRKFLTKTARTQCQEIMFIRDPFRLVPVNEISEVADKFTRNEILSPNEIRSVVGYKPSDDERSDELRNRNLNATEDQLSDPVVTEEEEVVDVASTPYEDLV